MTTEERRIERIFSEFTKSSNALLLKSFDQTRNYTEVVDDYRKLEAEFVAQMGDNDLGVLEMKRRIAESIFSLTHSRNPSFEASRAAWNDLVRLGFTSLFVKCMMSWHYADLCACDEQPEAGLAVLEPLIAEIEKWLEEARATQRPTMFYEDELEELSKLRDELEAQRRDQISPERITRRAHDAYYETRARTPEERRINEIHAAICETRRAVHRAFARSRDRSFAEIADDYRQVEADVIARAGACDIYKALVPSVRQSIAKGSCLAACGFEQPFEVCRDAWNELFRVGFRSIEEQCRMTRMYAESCGFNQRPEAGIAVVEALMEEIAQLIKKPEKPRKQRKKLQPPPMRTRVELARKLESLRELRDKLEALRKGAGPST